MESEISEAGALKLQNMEKDIVSTINEFLIVAFTTICVKKKLAPDTRDIFKHVFKFEMSVPVFKNPQAQMYLEGVAKKATVLIRQNALHSCVFHVKEARLYYHERFVFRIEGSWNIAAIKSNDYEKVLPEFKKHCQNCLLKIISVQHQLRPLNFPAFSRWSISVGLRNEFVTMLKQNGVSNPFDSDPDGHFPWKRTVHPTKAESIATRLNFGTDVSDVFNIATNSTNKVNGTGRNATNEAKDSSRFLVDTTNSESGTKRTADETTIGPNNSSQYGNYNDEEVMRDLEEILESGDDIEMSDYMLGDSLLETENEGVGDELDESKVFCIPVSSFPIFAGLIMNVYVLDYSEIINEQIRVLGHEQFLASTKGS